MKTPKLHILLAAAALSALAAGCASPPPTIGDDPKAKVSVSPEDLRVRLSVASEDTASATFAEGVRETAVSSLRGRAIKIAGNGKNDPRDLDLDLRVRQRIFDQSAEYLTLDGTVGARLTDAFGGSVLAEKTFRVQNGPALGLEKASIGLSNAVSGELSGWIEKTVVPSQIPLAACIVRVDRLSNGKRKAPASFPGDFVAKASQLKGVLQCSLESFDADAGTASFRFLYRRTDLPQGLVNTIVTAMPEYKFELK